MEKVFSIVRQTYGRSSMDPMKDFDVNTAIWWVWMSVTLQAAVHLGNDHTENRFVWEASVMNQSKLGKAESTFFWNTLSQRFGWDRRRADGVGVENFAGSTTLGILDEIPKMMTKSKCEPEQFKGRIIFVSMYNDIDWWAPGEMKKIVLRVLSKLLLSMLEDSREDVGRFRGLGRRRNGTERIATNGMENRIKLLKAWCSTLPKSGHPVFRATSGLERGEMKSKGKGKKTIHFNGSRNYFCQSVQCQRKPAELWKESARDSSSAGKPAANDNLGSMVIPTEFPTANTISQTDADVLKKLLREYEQKFAELPEQQKLTKLCSNAAFSKNIDKGHFFITLDEEGPDDVKTSCREYTLPRSEETSRVRSAQSWMWRSAFTKDVTVLRSWSNLYFETEQFLGFASWTKSNTWPKRQKKFLLQAVENGCTGKPVAKAKPRPNRLLRWLLCLFFVMNENGKFSQVVFFEVSKYMIRLLRHDDTVYREDDGAVIFDDLAELFKSMFAGTLRWSIEAWIAFLTKEGGPKKRFQYCLNPNSSKHFLYFRASQGHSGGTLVDPTLQDNVLLLDVFAEFVYHIGNAHDKHSVIQGGLIPGGKSQKGQAISVFHSPVVRQTKSGRCSIRSGPTQNRGVQKYVEKSSTCSTLVQSEARSKRSIAVLSNTIPRNRSVQHTTCDLYWESGVHEDWRGFMLQSTSIPKVTARRQDPPNPEARKSADLPSEQSAKYEETRRSLLEDTRRKHPGESQRWKCRETCRGNIDYRIPGIPHTTVQKEDSNRKETVKRPIEKFENHPDWHSLIHGPRWKTQSFLSKGICTVILWQDHYVKREFETVLLEHGWEKVLNWWMFIRLQSKRTIPVNVCGRYQTDKQNRKHGTDLENSHEDVDLENQHHFLTTYILGCTQRECQISKDIAANYRDLFEFRISAGAKEKLPTRASGKLVAETVSSWSYDMEGHVKKCVERNCEFANKMTQQLYKVATPCIGWSSI